MKYYIPAGLLKGYKPEEGFIPLSKPADWHPSRMWMIDCITDAAKQFVNTHDWEKSVSKYGNWHILNKSEIIRAFADAGLHREALLEGAETNIDNHAIVKCIETKQRDEKGVVMREEETQVKPRTGNSTTYYIPGSSMIGSGLKVFKVTTDLDALKTMRCYGIECLTDECRNIVEKMDWSKHVVAGPNAYTLTKETITAVLASAGLAADALFSDAPDDISRHAKVFAVNKEPLTKKGWRGSPEVMAKKQTNPYKDRDAFFTDPEIAANCWKTFQEYMVECRLAGKHIVYIEPSAGNGSFYNLLPPDQRIGLDIEPMCDEVQQTDFLKWRPDKMEWTYLAVGNPPFGYLSKTALQFLQRTQLFCEATGMILPQAFGSQSKSSPARRVMGYRLVHSEALPEKAFIWPDGKRCNAIPSVFQIWVKPEYLPFIDEYEKAKYAGTGKNI